MKLNKTILLGLVFGLTTVSTVWAGDSGGPLAVAPDRQEQKEQKYDADDQRRPVPLIYVHKQEFSVDSKFIMQLADVLEGKPESKVIFRTDEDKGTIEVKIDAGGFTEWEGDWH